ncbi:immunoglobulin-like domain-containing protein [Listeria riparia]|uniref:Putative peptidoglycan linked protein n=1 Tax=Listeria riparia FSL S10-1204 TaxID=1265816 RepID=W7D6A8_9LIST|nr:immunoglobulin-like domain-containing protein [Listeria riparia]EUJ44757.1 putative peptidoglycan linked protein [Listeria riparia FSL S10-1204]
MHGKAGSQGRLFNDETGVKLGARFTFDATGTYVLKLGSPLASGTKLKVWYTYNQTATYRTTVVDATKPVITASNQTLTVGDNFNPKAGVTASDDLDGDITSKIAVTSNNVDTSKVGTYSVSYSVTDAAGNVATKTITVTVKEAPDTTKPVITASNKTLTVGDSFDPKAGVTASDNKDGNITSKITVTSNNVDTSKAGTYSVTYSVSDAAGNIGTKTITVTVKEAPTSGTITASDFTIGKDGYIKGAITGDVASIKMIINGKVYSPRNVQSPSNYQYYVAGKITSVNDAVAIVAYDKNGKELDRANVNVKNNQAEVGTITAKTFTIGQDGYVQGSYTGKAAKVGLLVNGKQLNNISISGGSYRYYASHYITSVNDDVYAVLYDASGLEMARVKVAVQKAADNTSGTITANDFAIGDGDNYVRGTFTGDVAKVSMIVNGKEGTRISVSGGNYQYYAGSKISSVNDAVTVVAYDVNGKELDRKTVNVKKAEVPTAGTITAQDYLLGGNDKYIYGTTTGDAVVVKMMVNGKLIPAQRAVDADGSYKYYAGSNVTSINDVVTMITYDAKGKELDRTNVKLTQTAGTLAIDPYTLGDSYLTGKATGDVAKVQLLVNGVAKSTAFVKDGAFSYYAKSTITSKTGNYVLVGLDGAGRELTRQTVTVK